MTGSPPSLSGATHDTLIEAAAESGITERSEGVLGAPSGIGSPKAVEAGELPTAFSAESTTR